MSKGDLRTFRFAALAGALICLLLGPVSARAQAAAGSPAVAAWETANGRIRAAIEAGQRETLIALGEDALGKAERAFGPDARQTLANVRYLAEFNYEQGRYGVAAPLYERVIKGAGSQEDPFILTALDTLNALRNLAVIYQAQGRHAQAAPLLARAVLSSRRWMGPEHPETLELTAALAFSRLSDPALAAGALDPARTLAAGIRARRDTMAYPGVVRTPVSRRLGNRSRDMCQEHGLANVVATRARGNDLDAFVLLADADWAAAGRDPGRRPDMAGEAFVALQDAIVGTAAQAVERMAVRTAAERKAPGLGALVRDRQTLEDRAIANADDQARAVCAPFDPSPDPRTDPVAVGQRIEIEANRLDARLRAEFPDYYAFASRSALNLTAAQALLEPDEAILLVAPTPFGTQVMAISRSQVEWRRSDWDRGRVGAAVKRLLFDMGQDVGVDAATAARWTAEGGAGAPFDRKTAHALYRQLVAPVDGVLAGKRHVFIATSGALTSLPFGILVTEAPRGRDGDPKALRATRWFADAHALTVIPSVQALQFLRGAGPAPGRAAASVAFAGYGDPALDGRAEVRGAKSRKTLAAREVFQTAPSRSGGGAANVAALKSMARLPGTAIELENMRAAIGAPASSVRVRDQATEAAVRAADLSHVRILAFATHGLMAGELTGGSEPGLVFTPPEQASGTDDGFLTASEVTGMKLDADWVILSACNTAAGDGSEGAPGLSGLARAFFYAGARNLLVSHWPVRDDVASRLTVDAIRRRLADPTLSRAEALQRAMRAIRDDVAHDAGGDTWAHPNAWAPFSLIGDGAN